MKPVVYLTLLVPFWTARGTSLPDSVFPHNAEQIDESRLAIVGAAMLAGMATIHLYQENGWWKHNRRSFHFREDLEYGRGIDKLGHFYGGSVFTFVFSKSLQWSRLSESEALRWGAAASVLFQTFLEIQDGFTDWGFDRVDFAANIVGAFYPVLQHQVPFLRDLNPKFSYHPSALLNKGGGMGFVGQKHIIFDDYEGQTIWLNLNVNHILPGDLEPFWPDWLALAVGYGARGVAGPNPHSIYLVGLDYDIAEIIPKGIWFLETLGEALTFIRFPAPAVRIAPTTIWYGLYF